MEATQIYDQRYKAPGVYVEDSFSLPDTLAFTTGVPLFLGRITAVPFKAGGEDPNAARPISLWSQFAPSFGDPFPGGFLADAVHGFFKNGGETCYVRAIPAVTKDAIAEALEQTEYLDAIDLVCVPDIGLESDPESHLRQLVVKHCDQMGTRFAILDSRRDDDRESVWKQWDQIDGKNGALYYPWIKVTGCDGKTVVSVPPSGHIAGIYARTDRDVGIHKAPANQSVDGALDLARPVTDADQARLNPRRVNCLRSFPGRGIRVWGARTINGLEPWKYINVRRLFLTVARWVEWNMSDIAFENNDPTLWARIERELTTYFTGLFDSGALKGRAPQEAFFVKCDAETNTPDMRDTGQVVTEIGLAPTVPYEFIVLRLVHGPKGATIAGPSRAEQRI